MEKTMSEVKAELAMPLAESARERCVQCGDPLRPRRGGPGRPARYCSELCRRVGEYELRRLLRRLERADVEVEDLERRLRASYIHNEAAVRKELQKAVEHRERCQADFDAALTRSERGTSDG